MPEQIGAKRHEKAWVGFVRREHLSCSSLILAVALMGARTGAAQTTTTIESDGSEIVLTIWSPGEDPPATVLAVPGWGGGPADVLGIGEALSLEGVAVVVLTPRGWHASEGISSFANAFVDIEAALAWIRDSNPSYLEPGNVVLGGHSWGGGVALAYAARDTSVRRAFSVAGTDHGLFIRKYEIDAEYAAMADRILTSTSAPDGPIRFDVEAGLNELLEGQDTYGLIENAEQLADRSILIFGGWEDVNVTIDGSLLPLYRALKAAGAKDVTFEAYHDDHGFRTVREELHADLARWILRSSAGPGATTKPTNKASAERFFRGIYGCEPSVVDELAAGDVVVTYPVFERLFNEPAIRGRDAVRDFAEGFCSRWADARITVHEAVSEEDRVILVWSFRARNVGSADPERPPTNEEHSWGGITLYRFDERGKILAEIGEESAPGPIGRLSDE